MIIRLIESILGARRGYRPGPPRPIPEPLPRPRTKEEGLIQHIRSLRPPQITPNPRPEPRPRPK
jgi:hypothetical protein